MDAATAAQSMAARRALGAKACGDEAGSGEEAEEAEESEEDVEEAEEEVEEVESTPPVPPTFSSVRRQAAHFLCAWEAQPVRSRPHGLPCTLDHLPRQSEAIREILNEGLQRGPRSKQRHAPRLLPSGAEQAALETALQTRQVALDTALRSRAVWIPAAVRDARHGGTITVEVHWQPWVAPEAAVEGAVEGAVANGSVDGEDGDDGEAGGTLLCVHCYAPLHMASAITSVNTPDAHARYVYARPTAHTLPTDRPRHADTCHSTEHRSFMGLVCGGACWEAHVIARSPGHARSLLRRTHVKTSGSVYCQVCMRLLPPPVSPPSVNATPSPPLPRPPSASDRPLIVTR